MHKYGKTYYEGLLDNSALYLLFFNRNTELEQQSRAITREKTTPGMQKRTIENYQNPFFITITTLLHTD